MLEKKLARLKEARPDLYAKLGATPTEAEVDALLLEAVQPKAAEPPPAPAAATPAPVVPPPATSPEDQAILREAVIDRKVAKATNGRTFGPLKESAERLIRALETGEEAAGALLRQVGGLGEAARDLAYRLYSICERKKWAQEAMAYNSLVIAWPEISRLAQGMRSETQGTMF